MSEKTKAKPRFDPEVYRRNRDSVSLDELARFGGQWVAWCLDGTRIVAHHCDANEMAGQLRAAGISSEEVVVEYLPEGEADSYL